MTLAVSGKFSAMWIPLTDVEIDGFSQTLQIVHAGRSHRVRLPLVGQFQIENALVAAGLAITTGTEPWIEATIPQLRTMMANGDLTSRELTLGYLNRIRDLNSLLGAVIETNPTAVATAARLDTELKRGVIRGPLHGIPILVKDNIATDDTMQTTAGSLALVNSRVPADALLSR